MQTQRKELNFEGQNIYVGFDVHLKSWKVSIMVEDLFYKTFTQPSDPKVLHNYLIKNFPGGTYYSAYEAGFSGYWTHQELTKLGLNSIIVNPADIPTTGKEKVQKTDARDSAKIVRSLRNNELKPIYVPSQESIDDRNLVRMRKTIVKDLGRNKNRIKSFLYFNGIQFPDCFSRSKNHWSKRFMQWLNEIEFSKTSKLAFSALIQQTTNLRSQLLSINKEIRNLSKTDRYAESSGLLLSVPGIGLTTAMLFLAEIEDINRFSSSDKLCGYIGLIPSTDDSGEKESRRFITPRGHHVLRCSIVESAWVAIRTDPALCKAYNDYCKRMDSNKAIVRIARKLISRIKYVLTTRNKYTHCIVK